MIAGIFPQDDPQFGYNAWRDAVKALHGAVQVVWSFAPPNEEGGFTGAFQADGTNGDLIMDFRGTLKPETFDQDFPHAIQAGFMGQGF